MKSAIIDNNNVVTNVIVGSLEGSISCPEEVSIGWRYVGDTFERPAVSSPSIEEILEVLRGERNERLRHSDITQLVDAPLSAEQKKAWATYRQALRDLPETTDITSLTMEAVSNNASAVWPDRP